MQVNGFLGPTYPNRSTNFQSDRTINLYPELSPDPNAKTVLALIGTPGLQLLNTVGVGAIRGIRPLGGVMYVVSGSGLYSITTAGAVSALLGTLASNSGAVTIKDNGLEISGVGGNQLVICDKINLYIYNVVTGVFTTVTLSFTPGDVTYLDGYFIATALGSMSYYVSNLYDGLVWNALATAPVLSTPDSLVACCSPHQELWLIKNYTTEVWYNTGTPTSQGSPFQRLAGAVIDYGTEAPDSVVVGAGSMFMLANMRSSEGGQLVGIVMFNGYTPQVVSPPSINYQIAQMTDYTDAVAYMYSAEGHTFYVITFPTGNRTFAFDLTTMMLHERSSYTQYPYVVGKNVASFGVGMGGKTYVGGMDSNKIYEMGSEFGTDDGDPIVSIRVAPHLFDKQGLENLFIYRMQIDAEMGVGDGEGSDPQVELSFSDDGGHTYGNPYPASLGKQGEYKKELTWRRLGYTRNGVVKLQISDTCKRVILGGYAEVGK